MVKKKNNVYSKNNKEKTNNLHFNLNNLDDENFKEEALILYNAINEGKIDLDSNEKDNLLKELDLILNHFESSKSKDMPENSSFISTNFDEDVNSDFKEDITIKNQFNQDILDNSNSEVIVGFNDEGIAKKSSSDGSMEDEGSDDLSVDDALNELVDDVYYSTNFDNSFAVDESSDALAADVLIELVDDESSFGDNDDVLIELVDDESSDGSMEDEGSDDLSVDDALNDLIVNYSDEIAIKVENVSMQFTVSKDKIDTLKEFVIRTLKRNKSESKIFTALEDVSFEIPKGDRVGIIGFNGAGKSTLLKVLAGVYDATEGTINAKGKIAPLLELGAGFDLNYTGKDNIFLNGAFLGYPEEFLKEKYDEILEFSDLGEAINYHVKTYSSGMRAKLGFSIATIVEPDILIIDEILSVGDIKFRKKSADKIRSLINSGITVLLVSHSVGQIRDLCNKAIWIDEGKLKMYGEVNEVCDAYVKAANNATKEQLENIKLY